MKSLRNAKKIEKRLSIYMKLNYNVGDIGIKLYGDMKSWALAY